MRRLRKVNNEKDISKIKYQFYVFDTETTRLEPQPKNFVFGVIYGFYFNKLCAKVLYSVNEFINEFNKDIYRSKTIFAHNAEFDLLTIFGNIYSQIDNQAIFNNKFISAKYNYITFADSMNIYPSSVAKIGELLNIPKLENEKVKEGKLTKENMTEQDIRYCKRDCKIIFLALLQMFEEIGTIKLTISSLSMYLFRQKYLPFDISFTEIVDEFYSSYYGGRTEAFRIGKVNAKVYDINSMYPYVMVNCQFPDIRRLHKEVKVDVKYFMYLLSCKEGLAKVMVRHKDTYFGYLPVRMKINGNEKLVFPVGTFETTINFNELRFAIEQETIEILSVDYVVYGNPIDSPFIDFINDTYKKRQQTDNVLMRMIYKLLMNALYGRFAMRLKLTTTYYDDLPVQIIRELQDFDKFYNIHTFNQDRQDCYLLTENEKMKNSFFSIPTFSSYITSEARILLLKNLLANGKDHNIVYCDTDSIFLSGLFIGDCAGTLGSFKEEDKRIIEISGLKNYKYIDENDKEITVIKGISRNSIKISEGKYLTKKYYKTKGSLRGGKEAGESYEQIKELRHKYDKRIVLSNGDTKPLSLPLPIILKYKIKKEYSKNSRTYKVLRNTPTNLTEAILYFFVSGQRIKTNDFISLTGFNTKSKEYKKYFWCYSKNGKSVDTLNESFALNEYIENKITFNTIENLLVDLLNQFPSRGIMLTELEKIFSYESNKQIFIKEFTDESSKQVPF